MFIIFFYAKLCSAQQFQKKFNRFFVDLSRAELDAYFTTYDVKRLEMYSNNLVDYHLIMDLIPTLAKIYFLNQMGSVSVSPVQSVNNFFQPKKPQPPNHNLLSGDSLRFRFTT